MSMLNANFGEVIRDRRRNREMTQQEVASKVGTSTPYVGHLESGKRHPSDQILTRIADVLGFDRRELFFLANPHAKELLHPVEPAKASTAWEEFQRDDQLQKIHGINARE